MFVNTIVTILLLQIIHEGSIVVAQGVNLRCHCITKEKKPIGRFIAVLEVHAASSHCSEIQIIATLKMNNKKVCLDPEATWVKRVLKKRRARQKVKEQTPKA
ncbi:PREDICTED: alveolar macrophage chemotactic factor-like [Cyprinodon variegatus]|uniref:Alveolar macrophage chemotactic factor-like n=1 Tax=Cyprinodon variegatus TaxID=28743 RepID=A0A3Q2EF03_CYPVA|nr:PREDICTED: alveolar macrophage chemotactic factor-like [Cyprinodon variegatus]